MAYTDDELVEDEFEEYDDLGGSEAYLNASSALGCRMSETLREIRRWESSD